MLGSLAGSRVASLADNAGHSDAGPVVLLAAGVLAGVEVAIAVGPIRTAHVGLDCTFGDGPKFADAPAGDTHLQCLEWPPSSGGGPSARAD